MKRGLFVQLVMLSVVALGMSFTSCKKDVPTEEKVAKVGITLRSVDTHSAVVAVESTGEQCYVYCAEKSQTGIDATAIMNRGTALTTGSVEHTFDNLNPDTDYVAYALAINGSDRRVAEEEFRTLAAQDDFEGYQLNTLISAVYRTDNPAVAGNYELSFGNVAKPEWVGDIQVFLDLYNEQDGDPLNPVLPNGEYTPASECETFSYNPAYSYVDIVVEGGEIVSSPIMGLVTVERTGATYTITVEGTLMVLDNTPFLARYTGAIQFVEGGTSSYEYFDEDVEVEFDEAQMRYWGSWFYPFCDDLGLEMFAGNYDANGVISKGYYLHLSRVFMPKYPNYNDSNVPLADGQYSVLEQRPYATYAQPFTMEYGALEMVLGEQHFIGSYLTYIDEVANVQKVGFITAGQMSVTANGSSYTIVMNFTTDSGVKLTMSYEGELLVGNFNDNDESEVYMSRPWTTLQSDHVYNFPEGAVCYAYCFGDYMLPEYDLWMLMIYATSDQYPDGYGDMFTTELIVNSGDRTTLPVGEFNISNNVAANTMFCGTVDYGGSILFTYYGDLTPDAEGYSTHTAPIQSGSVTIDKVGDDYHFTFNMLDDGGHTITGEWMGIVYAEDISDQIKEEEGDGDHGHTH